MSKKNRIFIFTDGSSRTNPGIGGLAFVATNWNKEKILKKYRKFLEETTNNQAELLAIIEGIEWFLEHFDGDRYLVVNTDSRYCSCGFNNHIEKWASNNWKDGKMNDRKNIDLWKRLHKLKIKAKGRVYLQWIKGHNGNEYNEMADIMSYEVWQRWLRRNKKIG